MIRGAVETLTRIYYQDLKYCYCGHGSFGNLEFSIDGVLLFMKNHKVESCNNYPSIYVRNFHGINYLPRFFRIRSSLLRTFSCNFLLFWFSNNVFRFLFVLDAFSFCHLQASFFSITIVGQNMRNYY